VRHTHHRGASGSGAAHATAIIQSETEEEEEEEANSCLSLLSWSHTSFIEQSEKEIAVACFIRSDC